MTESPEPSPPFLPLPKHPVSRPRDESLAFITAMARRMDKALHCFHSSQVKAVRQGTGQSQRAFAARFGLSQRTLEQWESSRRQPDRAATALLKIIAFAPEVVEAAVQANPDFMTLFKNHADPAAFADDA